MGGIGATLRDWLAETLHLRELRLTARRVAGQSAVFGVAGLLGMVGMGFLVAALAIYLAQVWGAMAALLVLGGGFCIVAGIVAAAGNGMSAGSTVKRVAPPAPSGSGALTGAFGAEMLPMTAGVATSVLRGVRDAGGFVPLATALAGLAGGLYLRARLRERRPVASA